MFQFLSEMNWQLLAGIILVSAFVAYVGDVVGMRLGKKRISLFRLRPRHTSSIITAITGLLIALGVLTVLSFTSDSVRTALFSMKYIQRQITDLTTQVQDSRDELADMEVRLFENEQDLVDSQQRLFEAEKALDLARTRTKDLEETKADLQDELEGLQKEKDSLGEQVRSLRAEADSLRMGLEEVREGRIVVFSGELLGQVAVPAGTDAEQVPGILEELWARARYFVALRFGGNAEDVILDLPDEARISGLVEDLQGKGYRKVLRLLAASNALQSEEILIDIRSYVSEIVYPKGTLILSQTLGPARTEEEAENSLYALLREVNGRAVADGVLPDPLRRTVGNLSATEFYEAIEKLTASKQARDISVYALEDVYSEGPVQIELEIGSEK